jgi:nitroreductase
MVRSLSLDALVEESKRIQKDVRRKQEGGEPLPPGDQIRQIYATIWQELAELHKKGTDRLFFDAPALIICHVNPQITTTAEVDAGLAAMQMILMAEALELGTCLCAFLCTAIETSVDLREILRIPDGHLVPFAFMVGCPDVSYLRLVSRNPARVQWM